MPLLIDDDTLNQAGLSEAEARIEIACRLFDAEKLDLWPAAKLAGLNRAEFEAACHERKIAVYRPTIEEVREDLEHLRRIGG